MKTVTNSMMHVCLLLSLILCGGCSWSLDQSHYVYIPGEKLNENMKPLPVTVVINTLDDLRGTDRVEYIPFLILPIVPYVTSHYDRPETSDKFDFKGLNPGVDFANALMHEMKQNNMFSDLSLVQQNDSKKADLIVTGKIYKANIDTTVTAYGLSILGTVPWIVGLPQGKVYNGLDIHYEMRRANDNAVVWKWDVKGTWSSTSFFYYNHFKDEPYTGMNEILRKNLRDGLSVLAEEIKHKPLDYWKH